MKFINYIIIIILVLLSFTECFIKKLIRKKKKNHSPNVEILNYIKHPTCKNIVDIINNTKEYDEDITKHEYYGDVESWLKMFSNYEILYNIADSRYNFKDIYLSGNNFIHNINTKFSTEEILTQEIDGKTITIHLSLLPKKLKKAFKRCYKIITNSEEFDESKFNKNDCLEMNDDELRNVITEIINSSGNVKQYNKDKLDAYFQSRKEKDYCLDIQYYTDDEENNENIFGIGYKAINCLLITDMKNNLPNHYVNILNGIIERLKLALESGCEKVKTPENGNIIYRGQYFDKIVKQGDVLTNLGFLSTSLLQAKAENFVRRSGEKGVLFIIKNTNFNDDNTTKIIAKYIKNVSVPKYQSEEEVLLLPNQCFRIISVDEVEKRRNIELEAINCKDIKEAISF